MANFTGSTCDLFMQQAYPGRRGHNLLVRVSVGEVRSRVSM